jgi:hypothetical protein
MKVKAPNASITFNRTVHQVVDGNYRHLQDLCRDEYRLRDKRLFTPQHIFIEMLTLIGTKSRSRELKWIGWACFSKQEYQRPLKGCGCGHKKARHFLIRSGGLFVAVG